MRIEKHTLSDDLYTTTIEIKVKETFIPKNIGELIEQLNFSRRLEKHVEKLETLSKEELELAHLKIMSWAGYTKRDRDYLTNKIMEIYESDS